MYSLLASLYLLKVAFTPRCLLFFHFADQLYSCKLICLSSPGETIVRNNSVDQAVDYRDGMAKVSLPIDGIVSACSLKGGIR